MAHNIVIQRAILDYLRGGAEDIYDALVVEAASRCDYGLCAHCYLSCGADGSLMMQNTVDKICRALSNLHIRPEEIWIAGGEPTTNPRLVELIKAFARRTPYVALVTNGFSLACEVYARKIVAVPELKEIAITLNSGKAVVHNALVAPADAPMWKQYYGWELSDLKRAPSAFMPKFAEEVTAFGRIMRAFENIEKARQELGRGDLTVAINLNMSADMDLYGVVDAIEKAGGRLDKVIFQSLNRCAGRAKDIPDDHPLIRWQTPTVGMVRRYFEEADLLMWERRIHSAVCIDPLPDEIVKSSKTWGLSAPIYAAAATPAISVDGVFRSNVVSG